MGGIFSDGTPVWGRGTPGVVVGVAQNGTVGCEKVHFRRVSIGAAEKPPGLPTNRLAKPRVHPESA